MVGVSCLGCMLGVGMLRPFFANSRRVFPESQVVFEGSAKKALQPPPQSPPNFQGENPTLKWETPCITLSACNPKLLKFFESTV